MPRQLIESIPSIPEGRLQEWARLTSKKFARVVIPVFNLKWAQGFLKTLRVKMAII